MVSPVATPPFWGNFYSAYSWFHSLEGPSREPKPANTSLMIDEWPFLL